MPELIDLTGQRFGRWVVIGIAPKSQAGQTRWHCKCDCGNERIVQGGHLRGGKSVSCGCYQAEKIAELNRTLKRKHGGATHTHREKLYQIYQDIKFRCDNPNAESYHNYGGRGIKVCPEWSGEDGYVNFREWSYANGYDPNAPKKNMSIDRIDNDGDYSPDNCRWTDTKTQANNRRSNHRITIDGVTHTISEWADIVGIDQRLISSRIYNGWSEEDAVMRPLRAW